ncbi:MAG: hypothetical protein IPK83_19605 [Planctomycetes bacterium]|nr:hypothetical protein [Planctomycetota bacterium]
MTIKPTFRPPRENQTSSPAKAAKWGAAVNMARWINTRVEKRPWLEITSTTATA